MRVKSINQILANYPLGLTIKELKSALVVLGEDDWRTDELRHTLGSYPLALSNVERYNLDGEYEFPKNPSEARITYLANRRVKIRTPEDKLKVSKLGQKFYSQSNYQVKADTFENAIADTSLRGHQIVPVAYYRRRNKKGKLSIKSNECLSAMQIFMVEFDDKHLGYASLADMAHHPFIAENAALLMESVSGFPKCRVFFMLPQSTTDWHEIKFVIEMLLSEFDGKADPNGSQPSNGALGRVGMEHIWLDNYIQRSTLTKWAEKFKNRPKNVARAEEEIEHSELSGLGKEYREFIKSENPDAYGWYGKVPCPHVDHEHDGWDDGNNHAYVKPRGRGYLTACWKCERENIDRPKIRYVGPKQLTKKQKTSEVNEMSSAIAAHEAFVNSIKDGTMDIPEVEQKPSFDVLEERKMTRVRVGELSPMELSRPLTVLKKPERVQEVIQLVESDDAIRGAFTHGARLVVINSPTGSGKDEQMINMVLKHNKHSIETKPHHRVAIEKYDRWTKHVTAAHWTGVTWGADIVEAMDWDERQVDPFPEDGSWKCIQPYKVHAYMMRGGNRHLTICNDCPVKDKCYEYGFNAQAMFAKQMRAIVLAIPDLFINPIYETFCEKLYIVSPKDAELDEKDTTRLAVMDEVDPVNLFIECQLTMSQLQDWRVMWGDAELAIFAGNVEMLLENETTFDALSEYILDIDEDMKKKLSSQMSLVRVDYTSRRDEFRDPTTDEVLSYYEINFKKGGIGRLAKNYDAYKRMQELEIPSLMKQEIESSGKLEITLDVAFRMGLYGNPQELDADQISTTLPMVYSNDWNPLIQLQKCFEHYSVVDVPMDYRNKVLSWEILPQLHGFIKRLFGMSASVDETLFRRAFPNSVDETEFVEITPTPLIKGSQIFQIRTGKYCRGTVLETDDKRKPTGLKQAGQNLWDMFRTEVESNTEATHALVTYQCVLDWHEEWINEHPNVIAKANFWGLEGINEMQDADYVWVMFDPELDDYTIRRYARRFFGNDDEQLDFTRKDGYYADERVNRVWEAAVVGELLQAVGRARLNRVAGTVVILTAIEIPTVTNRSETLLFDLKDWMVDRDITKLKARIRQRELAEAVYEIHEPEILKRLQDGKSRKAIYKEFGVSAAWLTNFIRQQAGNTEK